MARELLNGLEVAEMLGIGENQARAAMRLGQLPCVQIGGRLYVARRALLKLLGLAEVVFTAPATDPPESADSSSTATDAPNCPARGHLSGE